MARLTKPQAEALVDLVEALRPEWSRTGITNALREAWGMGDDWQVAIAAVTAASDGENLTPATIAWQGPHWPKGKCGPAVGPVAERVAARATTERGGLCATCSQSEGKCIQMWGADHTFETLDQARARRMSKQEFEKYVPRNE